MKKNGFLFMKFLAFLVIAAEIPLTVHADQLYDSSRHKKDCMPMSRAKDLIADNKTMTEDLTDILAAFMDPKSCMAGAVKVDSDGAIDIAQTPDIAKKFHNSCVQGQGAAGGLASMPMNLSGKEDYFGTLLKRNKGKPEYDAPHISCGSKYLAGPYVVSSSDTSGYPLCFGLAKCYMPDGKKKNIPISCEAGMAEDIPYCAAPTACLQSGKVNVWARGVREVKN